MYVHTLLIRVLRTLLRITSDHHQTHELLHGLLYRYVDCMRSHGGMLSRLLSILTPRGCLLQVLQCYSATATSVMSLRDIDAVMPLLSSVRSIQIVHTERSSSSSFPSLPPPSIVASFRLPALPCEACPCPSRTCSALAPITLPSSRLYRFHALSLVTSPPTKPKPRSHTTNRTCLRVVESTESADQRSYVQADRIVAYCRGRSPSIQAPTPRTGFDACRRLPSSCEPITRHTYPTRFLEYF